MTLLVACQQIVTRCQILVKPQNDEKDQELKLGLLETMPATVCSYQVMYSASSLTIHIPDLLDTFFTFSFSAIQLKTLILVD